MAGLKKEHKEKIDGLAKKDAYRNFFCDWQELVSFWNTDSERTEKAKNFYKERFDIWRNRIKKDRDKVHS